MIKLICTLLVFPILVQAAPKSEVVLIEKVKWIEQKKCISYHCMVKQVFIIQKQSV